MPKLLVTTMRVDQLYHVNCLSVPNVGEAILRSDHASVSHPLGTLHAGSFPLRGPRRLRCEVIEHSGHPRDSADVSNHALKHIDGHL